MQNRENIKTIGVYVQVSNSASDQTSSYESQIRHYKDEIQKRPDWQLYRIYADEVKSGASFKHRRSFKKMIRDCKEHKINLILTKDFLCFSSDLIDRISHIEMLSNLTPPVGILFESEQIYTLDSNGKEFVKFLETLAYEETTSKSYAIKATISMRTK